MTINNILLTGGSGNLGKKILESKFFDNLLTPSRQEFDITKPPIIEYFFNTHTIDAVIHCAALARVGICETNPSEAIERNIIGTSNVVNAVLQNESRQKKTIRFIHISTDAVYEGERGNYSEYDQTIPKNNYGLTKLGAECAIRLLKNYCIIRTSFFNPELIMTVGFFIMAIRFAEVYASTSFISQSATGDMRGGPMVYLARVPGRSFLPFVYAFFVLLLTFITGNAKKSFLFFGAVPSFQASLSG